MFSCYTFPFTLNYWNIVYPFINNSRFLDVWSFLRVYWYLYLLPHPPSMVDGSISRQLMKKWCRRLRPTIIGAHLTQFAPLITSTTAVRITTTPARLTDSIIAPIIVLIIVPTLDHIMGNRCIGFLILHFKVNNIISLLLGCYILLHMLNTSWTCIWTYFRYST